MLPKDSTYPMNSSLTNNLITVNLQGVPKKVFPFQKSSNYHDKVPLELGKKLT